MFILQILLTSLRYPKKYSNFPISFILKVQFPLIFHQICFFNIFQISPILPQTFVKQEFT